MVVGIDNDSTGDSTQGERPEMILLNRGNLIYSFDYQVWRLFGKISLYYGSYYCNLFEQAAIICMSRHSFSLILSWFRYVEMPRGAPESHLPYRGSSIRSASSPEFTVGTGTLIL